MRCALIAVVAVVVAYVVAVVAIAYVIGRAMQGTPERRWTQPRVVVS